ncbi:MAG TPA: ABC transporter ATP-binding protein [Candidatus Eremiobacteraceae bacterium]|nr:ABC transporter ATP-binding protein [Candidatus Eremiobacteraceae bacterium]
MTAAVSREGSASAGPSPAIHTVDLAKQYGDVAALAALSMSVPRGEVFGFLGPNGAGKTTAVKLLLGLTFPSGGEAFVLGAPVGDRETRRKVGYLPELFRYQDWLSAREVLGFHCVLAGVSKGARTRHVDDALETVGLAKRASDRVGSYSKGMQQRLGLAVALIGEPELILLDEPTSALDPVGRREVRDVLHALKRRGVTVFLNSHLLTEVEQVCDRVAIVDRGRVIAIGPLAEITGDGWSVRIKMEAASPAFLETLKPFGQAAEEEGGRAIVLRGVTPGQVPDAVAALVRAGARITAVEPNRRSLEDQFIRLLHGSADAAARDR